jgi:hypothetical protein
LQAKLNQSIQQFAGIFYVYVGILGVGCVCLVLVSIPWLQQVVASVKLLVQELIISHCFPKSYLYKLLDNKLSDDPIVSAAEHHGQSTVDSGGSHTASSEETDHA